MQESDPSESVCVLNEHGSAPILITCEHASNAIPPELDGLGLAALHRHQHIAFDIGARALAEVLCYRFNAPLVNAQWSRLVVDLNRYPDDPSLIPELSDSVPIPGNANLSQSERAKRVACYHRPYHARLGQMLDEMTRRHSVPAVLMLHSFTPQMHGKQRPWELGVLYEDDSRMSDALIEAFGPKPGFTIGRNEPYDARTPRGYTMFHHVVERGLPYICIEVRQDLLRDAAGVSAWADRLGPALHAVMSNTVHHTLAGAQ